MDHFLRINFARSAFRFASKSPCQLIRDVNDRCYRFTEISATDNRTHDNVQKAAQNGCCLRKRHEIRNEFERFKHSSGIDTGNVRLRRTRKTLSIIYRLNVSPICTRSR